MLAAGLRLLNEWRDTALVVTCGALALAGVPSGNLVQAFCFREFGRAYLWMVDPPLQIINGPEYPPPKAVAASSFSVAAMTVATTYAVMNSDEFYLLAGVPAMIGIGISQFAGGPSGVLRTMCRVWDFPRNSGDDGPSQTDKFMGGISKLWASASSAVGGLLPSPQPARAMTTRRALPAQTLS